MLGRRIEDGDDGLLARTGSHVLAALELGVLLVIVGSSIYTSPRMYTSARRFAK